MGVGDDFRVILGSKNLVDHRNLMKFHDFMEFYEFLCDFGESWNFLIYSYAHALPFTFLKELAFGVS